MDNLYDVVIIGGGPAGLTAALYLGRAKYRTVVVEKEKFGGQITITSEVVNYPGVERTSGTELTETMRKQAENFGAEFIKDEVISINTDGDIKTVVTRRGELKCFGIVLATGASPRMVGFKGEAEFKGHGVAYCATCDGEFFTGKEVFVVGGGFAAAEESVFLTKYAKHVTILIRRDDFSCAESVADKARSNPKITVLTNTEVEEAGGDEALRFLRYRNNKTGEVTEYHADDDDSFGIFVFSGYAPQTGLLEGKAEINKDGYIVTDGVQKTTVDGVYAAGDICVKPLRQVVTAVHDGAVAAGELEHYVSAMQTKTGLVPAKPEIKEAATKTASALAANSSSSSLFDEAALAQLNVVFDKMTSPVILKLSLDTRAVSEELKNYMYELENLSDKINVEIEASDEENTLPAVKVFDSTGSYSGLAFHGVPGGHEFTSFILGLYNVSGPGQSLDSEIKNRIKSIKKNINIKILVSLTCTMCPDLVIAAQRIASINPKVTAEVYDINHFESLKNEYKVMSVPCMVVNDSKVTFGRKNIEQVLDVIEEVIASTV